MKLKRLLRKLSKMLDAKNRKNRQSIQSLRAVLKDLKQKEKKLNHELAQCHHTEQQQQIQNQLNVIALQRAKGKQRLLILRAQQKS